MKENYSHINDAYLLDYFQNHTTDTENKQLENWIKFSKKNRAQFESIKQLWEISSLTEDFQEIDTNTSWQQVNQRIKGKQTKVSKTDFLIFWKIAAAIFLFVGISISFFMNKDTTLIAGVTKEYKLPDGTQLWLKKGSELIYTDDFNNKNREVILKGEAYFNVAKNIEKPFNITLNNTTTTVLGTQFNIKSDTDNLVTLVLKEGSVKFSNTEIFKIIKPGETVKTLNNGTLMVSVTKNINFDSWKTKQLLFNKTPLAQVVKDVTSVYGTQLIIENKALLNCKLTSTFNNQSLNEIVETLTLLYQFSVVKKGGTILLTNGHCAF